MALPMPPPRHGPSRRPLRLLSAAVVAAAAAATVAATVPPRSTSAAAAGYPVPRNVSLGSFHRLPALACDKTAPGTVGGHGRAYTLPSASAGGGRTTIPVDAAVCWSPVEDDAARASATVVPGVVAGGNGSGSGGGDPVVAVTPTAYRSTWTAVERLRNGAPAGRTVRNVDYVALTGGPVVGGGGGDGQLLREGEALRLLTLHRNSISGGVHRKAGTFDVAAVSRITLGLCRQADCVDATAVNVLGARRTDFYSPTSLPLLLYTPDGDGGQAEAVRIDDSDLLSLGRAVVDDPGWLPPAAAPSWRLTAGFTLKAWASYAAAGRSTRKVDALGPPWTFADTAYMGNTSATEVARSGKWLQAVAYVLCAAPVSSFVVDGWRGLCGDDATDAYPAPVNRGGPRLRLAEWTFDPDAGSPRGRPAEQAPLLAPLPPCGDLPPPRGRGVRRPGWLAGRADREVAAAAAAEVALANAISTCAYPVGGGAAGGEEAAAGAPPPLPWEPLQRIKWSPKSKYAPLRATLRLLAERYDRGVWGVPPPPEPASDADITLAIIVVLPEAMALVALLLTTPRWRRKEWTVFLLLWAAGAVSTAGILTLAVEEAGGAAWRAAAVRTELAVRLHSTEQLDAFRPLDRMPLFKTETLLMAARLGYRRRLLVALAAVVTAAYALLSVAVAGVAARRTARAARADRRRHGGGRAAAASAATVPVDGHPMADWVGEGAPAGKGWGW
ncbi:hypothetical protein I4F81_000577 [Pyropia yezoensis]|uniref:Uncharacterized protein n=1 Tax=Pyropia yezoensis TaxID=2788 RepID=A0ACC3BJ64_PYRYE|nr:hypothetical protein I4F81_000577 [Neopyropia yezoensis]